MGGRGTVWLAALLIGGVGFAGHVPTVRAGVATLTAADTTSTTSATGEVEEDPVDDGSRPTSTTAAPPVRPCDANDLRTSVVTDRAEYAPDDWIVATTTIRNVGRRTCQVRQYADYDGCQPAILLHISFDPGTGTYGDTTWTFGPYPACPPPALTLEPGEAEQRVNRFRFGQGRSGELPDGDWQVISQWDEITRGDGTYPVAIIRCTPGTCKPLAEYRTTTTTGRTGGHQPVTPETQGLAVDHR